MSPEDKEVLEDLKLNREDRTPRYPTAALPGTPEKIAVMAARFARKEHLYHPLDAKPNNK